LPEHVAHGGLRADVLGLDHLVHRDDERLVLQHARVEEEDLRGLIAHLFLSAGVNGRELLDRRLDRIVQLLSLRGNRRIGDRTPGQSTVVIAKQRDMPDRDAGRYRDALDDLHPAAGGRLGGNR